MDLRNCLGIALLAALTASVVVVGILLLNLWAALLVGTSLAAVVLQLLGIMGLCDIKLSAVPAVLLVVSVGIAVHFTVHICLVSINREQAKFIKFRYFLYIPIRSNVLTFIFFIFRVSSRVSGAGIVGFV